MKMALAIIDMEVRGVEMYFLTVFTDNTVEYIHYRELKQINPYLYYGFFK